MSKELCLEKQQNLVMTEESPALIKTKAAASSLLNTLPREERQQEMQKKLQKQRHAQVIKIEDEAEQHLVYLQPVVYQRLQTVYDLSLQTVNEVKQKDALQFGAAHME